MVEPGRHHGTGPRTIEGANARRADERLPLSDPHKGAEVAAPTLADPLAGKFA